MGVVACLDERLGGARANDKEDVVGEDVGYGSGGFGEEGSWSRYEGDEDHAQGASLGNTCSVFVWYAYVTSECVVYLQFVNIFAICIYIYIYILGVPLNTQC